MTPEQTILLVENEPDDVFFLRRALVKDEINNPIVVVHDDHEAIKYLDGQGEYADRERFPVPSAIFTDHQLPRIDAFRILDWMKSHPQADVIPTIILTSTRREPDVKKAYDMGAHAYMVKPLDLEALQALLMDTYKFWSWCEVPKVG